MGSEAVNYEAVLADIEARIAKLQATAEGIRMIMAQGGGSPSSPSGGSSGNVRPSDFLAMSIPEATKKYLNGVRQKRSTQDIMKALEAGGLPASSYQTVYGVLRRREKQVGDLINMQGDWALAEWYPNYRKRTKEEVEAEEAEEAKAENAEKKSA